MVTYWISLWSYSHFSLILVTEAVTKFYWEVSYNETSFRGKANFLKMHI